MSTQVTSAIEEACSSMGEWLRTLPKWRKHPVSTSGSVSAYFGPTILSEEDCVMHFASHLHAAGVPWEDMHMEFSPGQWLLNKQVDGDVRLPRIDLAVIRREELLHAELPAESGAFVIDAVIEFKLAGNFWQHGRPRSDAKAAARVGVEGDIAKVGQMLEARLADAGYVVVIEEADHGFAANWGAALSEPDGQAQVRVLRYWNS